jgi:hypothetical protein
VTVQNRGSGVEIRGLADGVVEFATVKGEAYEITTQ